MVNVLDRLDLIPIVSALVCLAALALAFMVYMVRRGGLAKRVVVPPDWMPFEQRRFHNPGALPRGAVTLLLSLVLVGGAVSGPFVLGLDERLIDSNGGWGWGIAVVGAIALSVIAGYVLRPKRPRCPYCKSAALEKAISIPKKRGSIRVYLCRSCQIVWQTDYFVGMHKGSTTYEGLNTPNPNF